MKKGILAGLFTLVLSVFVVAPAYATYNGTVVEPEVDGTTYKVTADAGDQVTLSGLGSGTGVLKVTFANGTTGSFVVTESSEKPAAASTAAEGAVNLYFDIDLVGLTNDDVASAVWTFTVEKSWLSAQGVTAQNVFLQHWNGSAWERLTTREVSSTDTTVTFEADITSFSPFAVTAVAGLSNTGSPAVIGFVIAAGILAVVGGTFYLSRRASAKA